MSTSGRPSLARRLALAVVIGVVMTLSAAGSHGARPAIAADVPSTTSSFYVYGSFIDVCGLAATTECPLYDDGAREAVSATGGMTILDFGAPCYEPGTRAWGTQLFNSQGCTPDSTLAMLAGAWLRGYDTNPNRTAASNYVLVVGTSNSLTAAVAGNALTADEMSLHGRAWFNSVVTPVAEVARLLPSQVTVWAGNDIEESSDGNWYDGPTTSTWVDAYAAASGASKPCMPTQKAMMVDFGDYVPTASGWSAAAVYHVAWQAAPACPVPEIYNAVNATEWQSLNAYAVSAGLPQLRFMGVLSQDGADGTLSSSDSWNTLRSATGQAAPYINVIGTTGPLPPEVPDPPSDVTAVAGPGMVMLHWSAPAWDGGAGVTTYTVTVYAGSIRAQAIDFSGFPAPETGIVTGLDDGTPYRFYVSATNRVGTGPQSLPSDTVIPDASSLLR